MSLHLADERLNDLDFLLDREWLETDGLGGFAGSTLVGANTRRYHGLLVAATRPPVGREVLLARLDEVVEHGGARLDLATALFPGCVHPPGWRWLRSFARDLVPCWTFDVGNGLELRKSVVMPDGGLAGAACVLIAYELQARSDAATTPETAGTTTERAADPSAGIVLELRPFLAGRDYHALGHRDERPLTARADGDALVARPSPTTPEVAIVLPGAQATIAADWWYRFELPVEEERGFDHREDLWTPGVLRRHLAVGELVCVVATTATVEAARGIDGPAWVAAEQSRREALLARALAAGVPVGRGAAGIVAPPEPTPPAADSALPTRLAGIAAALGDLGRALVLAADPFIVRRGPRLSTVIAGYPWFGDWGRDTMIALPGLCLATGRREEARRILLAFAGAMSQGMLPNRFLDAAESAADHAAEYNTVDATLWFFQAVRAWLAAARAAGGSEAEAARETTREVLLPALRDAVAWHRRGTRHGIRVDPEDGLLAAGEPGVQLTWMDARVGDWVVTPRHGKPIEIQALWANALMALAELEELVGDPGAAPALRGAAAAVAVVVGERFADPDSGGLGDVLAPDGSLDRSVRPNQLYAVSLPYALVQGAAAERVLAVVEQRLLTPVGLRSLDPRHPDYRPRYRGGPVERDGAYHQGTVWSFLLGPYVDALLRLRGDTGRLQALTLLADLTAHLGEAGIGTVSEIFDGEATIDHEGRLRHRPAGCFAQAWGVAEWLRALVAATARRS